ncbi:hypothetical protein Ahy_A07g031915 isoform A [Arachis hypogaea]|uniref:TF-B3 domain-containing protein n=1 Tax=Arachis hypogaea TaxID=3818 RepID=A0A445C5D8_ARAHY|nr:hypothetical protein Ahy_A07g031915 isoform A [Arachis hypogaea]
MPSFFFNHEEDPDFLQMLRDQFSNIDKADWVLYNSFYKLEKQENVNTRHPQLLYESKLYRILQGRMFLKPPDGTLWKVYWTKKNSDEVWFVKGWKEFTKNYSLNEGHLVVFKYEETSQFDVIILEINDLERVGAFVLYCSRSAEQSRLQRRTGANLFDRAEERGNGEFDGAARASLTAQQGRRRRR